MGLSMSRSVVEGGMERSSGPVSGSTGGWFREVEEGGGGTEVEVAGIVEETGLVEVVEENERAERMANADRCCVVERHRGVRNKRGDV